MADNGITRRQLIVGGVSFAAGWGTAQVTQLPLNAQQQIELAKLRALVALYEQLEKVGVDAIIQTGMNIVRGALETVKGGVRLMRDGITAIETALKNFQAALDALKAAANIAGAVLDDLLQKFRLAEGFVVGALGV
ncbi:MAG: hypothetical protein HY070_06430, partial [Chloroflexi bacterium]|nr:hypothetical protein [Chloroflexota bacterium]